MPVSTVLRHLRNPALRNFTPLCTMLCTILTVNCLWRVRADDIHFSMGDRGHCRLTGDHELPYRGSAWYGGIGISFADMKPRCRGSHFVSTYRLRWWKRLTSYRVGGERNGIYPSRSCPQQLIRSHRSRLERVLCDFEADALACASRPSRTLLAPQTRFLLQRLDLQLHRTASLGFDGRLYGSRVLFDTLQHGAGHQQLSLAR